MEPHKRMARTAGVLILMGMLVGILSIVPAVEGPNFLIEAFPGKNQVLAGAAFQLLLVPIYIGFALILYGSLKKQKERSALGFVGFRFVSGVFQLLGVILLPIFIYLSQAYLSSPPESKPYLEDLGMMLQLTRDLTNHLGVMVPIALGNLLLYYIFYSGRLIPHWLSLWGVMGNMLLLSASFLLLFQLTEVISTTYIAMTAPLVIQELVLAIWLIFKGLDGAQLAQTKEEDQATLQAV